MCVGGVSPRSQVFLLPTEVDVHRHVATYSFSSGMTISSGVSPPRTISTSSSRSSIDEGVCSGIMSVGVGFLMGRIASTISGRVWRRRSKLNSRHKRRTRQESVRGGAEVQASQQITSPFSSEAPGGKAQLPLTAQNVELVLDTVRPFLRNDGGDCRVVEIDGAVVRLELQGACSDCSASSVTLKMGIERALRDRIPDIEEVVAVAPGQEPASRDAVEALLDEIRPLLRFGGSWLELHTFVGEPNPRVVLMMASLPFKSMAVRAEVVSRLKSKFPSMLDVSVEEALAEL